MSIKDIITPEQHQVAKDIGRALVGADADAWHRFTLSLKANLTAEERAALGWAVMRSVDYADAGHIYRAAVVPPPITSMQQAAIEYRAARDRAAPRQMRRAA